MKSVRWVLLAGAALTAGATLGFVVSLLRPRKYAEFAGVTTARDDGAGLARR